MSASIILLLALLHFSPSHSFVPLISPHNVRQQTASSRIRIARNFGPLSSSSSSDGGDSFNNSDMKSLMSRISNVRDAAVGSRD